MKKGICLLILMVIAFCTYAQNNIRVSGVVTDKNNNPLFNASVYIPGSSFGSGTNAQGRYFLTLPPGDYTIICRYLGFKKQQKRIHIGKQPVKLNFIMQPVAVHINEVIIHAGPDPAYAIIKKAIEKRPFYETQVKNYTCMAYVKGVVKLIKGPDRMLGQDIDYSGEIIDSANTGIFYLTESLSKISREFPHHYKQKVIASRKSGGGMGFDIPIFIDFYQNNMPLLSRQVIPRGYISPIADHALHYYTYHLTGTFIEDGHLVNKIKVTPKRKHEPLYSGYINIMDSSWRIHSLDLMVTKVYQLQLIDSLAIKQIHAPVAPGIWRVRNQSLTFKFDLSKLHLQGRFLNVYSNYNVHPHFSKDHFDNRVILWYDSLSVKRDLAYWDSTRPVPLSIKEKQNFIKKDSLHKARLDSLQSKHYRDSIQKAQKGPGLMDVLWKGYIRSHHTKPRYKFGWQPLLKNISYNTVEGLVTRAKFSFSNYRDSGIQWSLSPQLRYGWSNHHFNASLKARYQSKKQFGTTWEISGGKRVSQINKNNPISPFINSLYTLLGRENYMKIYENYFISLKSGRRYINGFGWNAAVTYEDRYPLYNTTDFSLLKNKDKAFTPNHPVALSRHPFIRHQALEIALQLRYQPGQYYIQFPWGKRPVGSKAPVFGAGYSKGIPGILNSDVNYDKWYVNIQHAVNMKLKGKLKYKVQVGGFLNKKRVGLPDMKHFNGNQTFFNIKYMNSFQLAPYYQYSNTASFYSTLNLEYHLNGFLTNKIPLFNRLHWDLVLGTNAFYIDKHTNYVEGFAGLENILKIFRVDFISSYQSGDKTAFGIRIGFGGILGINNLK